MKRYFYMDPLAAAWMAKHFGMRFASWDSGKEYDAFMPIYNAGSPIDEIREDQRYAVHPDSLPLLEPQSGDLVYRGALGCDIVDHIDGSRAWFSDGDGYRYSDIEIIQREGKPFHHPQSEQPQVSA